MKKIISALLVASCLFMAVPAQAQLRWGLKGGLNLNKANLSGFGDNFKAENTTGFFVGPMVEFTIPIAGLGLDGALLYSQKKAKVVAESINTTNELKQHSLEIPVNLKYSIGLGKLAGVFFAVGPSFGFNLKSTDDSPVVVDSPDAQPNNLFDNSFRKASVSLNFGVGVKLIKHIQVGVNYNLLLTESAKTKIHEGMIGDALTGKDKSFKNNGWQVSLAYLF